MAKLIYSAITSLDGYVADANGKFDWAVRRLKASAQRDISVGGPELAAQMVSF